MAEAILYSQNKLEIVDNNAINLQNLINNDNRLLRFLDATNTYNNFGGYSVHLYNDHISDIKPYIFAFTNVEALTFPLCNKLGKGCFYNASIKQISGLGVSCSDLGYISDYAFYNCSSMVYFGGSNFSYIGNNAFAECTQLIYIYNTLSKVNYIGHNAFSNCYALNGVIQIDTYDSVYIGKNAFMNCYNIRNIFISNAEDVYIDDNAFNNMTNVYVVGLNATELKSTTFKGCNSINTILLYKLKSLEAYTFNNRMYYNMSNIMNVMLYECEYIGSYNFGYCEKLINLNIPKCKSIDYFAFFGCSSLSIVNLLACEFISDVAFGFCSNITTIYAPEWISYSGSPFVGCSPQYFIANKLSTLPEHFSTSFFKNIINVEIKNIPYINSSYFKNCSNLTSITLEQCSYIGEEAFYGCPLNNLTLLSTSKVDLYNSNAISYSEPFSINVPSIIYNDYVNDSIWSYFSSYIIQIE